MQATLLIVCYLVKGINSFSVTTSVECSGTHFLFFLFWTWNMSSNQLQTHSDKLSLFLHAKTYSETKCHKAAAAKSLFSLFSSPTCLVCLPNPEKSDRWIQEHSSNILPLLYFLWLWCQFFCFAKHCSYKPNLAYDGSSMSTRVG